MRHFCVPLKMRWLLKSSFDQNSILIDHKFNDDFKSYFIFLGTQDGLLALLLMLWGLNMLLVLAPAI
jgi:hypothetical protein